jgi:alpha-beta hydrolase superfamily lysophospholipase
MNSPAKSDTFIFTAPDDQQIFCHRWPVDNPKAIVQLVHGGSEHGGRYAPLAQALNEQGYTVYAEDHRGHGRTGELNGQLGDMGHANAFERACDDVLALGERARIENAGIPLVILGHSLGSLITQRLLLQHSGEFAAAILSGSPDIFAVANAADLVHAEVQRLGRGKVSEVLEAGIVEGFNAAFPDENEAHVWLSRDAIQRQKYDDDPWCGYPLCASAWQDLITAMMVTVEAPVVAAVRKDLPIYILSGENDPSHGQWQAITRLEDNYRKAGILDITVCKYIEGRHEMFNEINREEVIAEMLHWLKEKLP